MKSMVKTMVTLGILAAMAATAGIRTGVAQTRHSLTPAIHHMVADGDIGDGTSPSKKG